MDLFDYLKDRYLNEVRPQDGDVAAVDQFIDSARETLKANQPVGVATVEDSFGLQMQDGKHIPLVDNEPSVDPAGGFNSAPITSPRGGRTQGGFSKEITDSSGED